jgi:hypothetical protein
MTTPTIFSDKAVNPNVSKYMPQGMLFQKATALIPGGTAVGTYVGMIRFREGFVLNSLMIKSDVLAGGAEIDVGFVLDDTTGENPDQYINQSGVPISGTSVFWPSTDATSQNIGLSPVMPGPGYISVQFVVSGTANDGNIHIDCSFSYDD